MYADDASPDELSNAIDHDLGPIVYYVAPDGGGGGVGGGGFSENMANKNLTPC